MAAHPTHQPDPKNEALQKQSRARAVQPGLVAPQPSLLALQRAVADPRTASPRDILALQRMTGNQGTAWFKARQ